MDGGIICVMTFISACKQSSKSDIQACEEELLKGKSISSGKSQFLGDESSRLRGRLSKKGSNIYDSIYQRLNLYQRHEKRREISHSKHKFFTLELRSMTLF